MGMPRTAAGWTVAVFGALALLLGVLGLARPATLLGLLGFVVVEAGRRAAGDYTAVFVAASAMASVNMGVYYLLAAATEWRAFFHFTVIFRLVTFSLFTGLVVAGPAPARFLGVALWEGLGALATGGALALEKRRRSGTPAPASKVGEWRIP